MTRWLVGSAALLLAACPLPCPSGTRTNGGDQCVAGPVQPVPLSGIQNDTGAPLAVVVSQINERACDRKVRRLDDSSAGNVVDPHAQSALLVTGGRFSSQFPRCAHVRLTSGERTPDERVSRYYLALDGTQYTVRIGPDGRPEIPESAPATGTAPPAP